MPGLAFQATVRIIQDGVYAFRETGIYPDSTEQSGKWLVFLPPERIDAAWQRIHEAVRLGKLGGSAKVATRPGKGREEGEVRHVICVYTYDYTDSDDVRRIRQVLRELGIIWRIPYKADEDTLAGRYRSNTSRISRYYE